MSLLILYLHHTTLYRRLLSGLLIAAVLFGKGGVPLRAATPTIQAPVLKWQRSGCYSSWCETGWYSSPAVTDLDGDGKAEVIFASWTQKGSSHTGKLHILNYLGNVIHEVDLPAAFSGDWNGALAAPTLAEIDGDGELEVVLNTAHSGLVAYDLPGTSNARILWGTGRGNYQRTGSILRGSLESSYKRLELGREYYLYKIILRNPGPVMSGVRVTDTIPSQADVLGLGASSGSFGQVGNVVTWTGNVLASVPVTITIPVVFSDPITTPHAIVNIAFIDDGLGNVLQRQAAFIVNGYAVYLPIVVK